MKIREVQVNAWSFIFLTNLPVSNGHDTVDKCNYLPASSETCTSTTKTLPGPKTTWDQNCQHAPSVPALGRKLYHHNKWKCFPFHPIPSSFTSQAPHSFTISSYLPFGNKYFSPPFGIFFHWFLCFFQGANPARRSSFEFVFKLNYENYQ